MALGEIDLDLVKKWQNFGRGYTFIPLSENEDTLRIALADSVDVSLEPRWGGLECMLDGLKIEYVLVPSEQFYQKYREVYDKISER